MLSGLPHDEYLKSSGRLAAFTEVLLLIDTLTHSQRLLDERTADHRPSTTDTAQSDALLFWGSPYARTRLFNGTGDAGDNGSTGN